MKTVTLKNSFHNTEVRVRVPYSVAGCSGEAWIWIQEPIYAGRASAADRARYRRVCKALCGMSDCTCGIVR
jgi:hypothetical protein